MLVGSEKAIRLWLRGGIHAAVERRTFRCQVARPLSPVVPGAMIDRLMSADARSVIAAGYPASDSDTVEGIRLDRIEECYFNVRGMYGGNNSIHLAAAEDLDALESSSTIPPQDLIEIPGSPRPKQRSRSADVARVRAVAAHYEILASRNDRAFDAYLMVDWSSSSRPTTGNDSIWMAMGAWSDHVFTFAEPINAPTRVQAGSIMTEQLSRWQSEGKRVLVGLDFAFGYPAGFAGALGLMTTEAAWKAVHAHFAAHVIDSPDNSSNRDAFAEACNLAVGAPGPFWGCARTVASAALTQHRVGVFNYPHHGLAEWRVTDMEARRKATTQSVWKLNCGVSVGGQTILGIKYLDELARAVTGHRWPFEGWGTPQVPGILFAEIFPSLVYYSDWVDKYSTCRDRAQVLSCVRRAAERDRDGLLRGDFDRPSARLSATALANVENEEGWILWV